MFAPDIQALFAYWISLLDQRKTCIILRHWLQEFWALTIDNAEYPHSLYMWEAHSVPQTEFLATPHSCVRTDTPALPPEVVQSPQPSFQRPPQISELSFHTDLHEFCTIIILNAVNSQAAACCLHYKDMFAFKVWTKMVSCLKPRFIVFFLFLLLFLSLWNILLLSLSPLLCCTQHYWDC